MNSDRPIADSPIDPRLGMWDTVSIIVGIVVGTAIFRSSTMVFANAGGPGQAVALWLLGGVLAWCGAVCYAELATTYPRDGGDYEYLNRAFGRWCGFLFAWTQLTAIVSGNIAIMAYAFADYGVRLWPSWETGAAWIAATPVVVLSALNALGLAAGKWMQNVLTVGKIIGISGLVAAGIWAADASVLGPRGAVANEPLPGARVWLALVFVLYAYGGWSHAAYVGAEVRDQRRNLPRALLFGLAVITIIYLAVNTTYLAVLGFDGARHVATPAAEVLELACGPWGARAMSVLVMISALGAINGMVLTASRIYATWGADYPALAWLGAWNRSRGAPIAAIGLQAVIAVFLILLVGTTTGRWWFDAMIGMFGATAMPWGDLGGGFEKLVAGSAPVFWLMCLLTGVSVFVLRWKDGAAERPFRIPMYPWPPLVFIASCGFMLSASLEYAGWLALIGAVPLVVGIGLWLAVRKSNAQAS
jgi:amino acid transporter